MRVPQRGAPVVARLQFPHGRRGAPFLRGTAMQELIRPFTTH
jgi:hypothetical protein